MKIVCLANSFRDGGRCLGGIELDQNNNPVIRNGRPKWVRPVYNTTHEEVPLSIAASISLLDIIEFESIRESGHGHQSENILFIENSIKIIGKYSTLNLDKLTDNNRFFSIFSNAGAAVPEHKLIDLDHSLMLLGLTEFEVNERIFEEKKYPQIKLSFKFKDKIYNFPITDPSFLHKYGINNSIVQDKDKIYVSLSLAAPFKEWSSKLVAGIIFNDENYTEIIDIDPKNLPF